MTRLNYEQVSGFFCGLAAAVSLVDPHYEPVTGVPGSGVMRVTTQAGAVIASVSRSILTSTEVIEQWFQYEVMTRLQPRQIDLTEPVAQVSDAPQDVSLEEDSDYASEEDVVEDDLSDLL